jgi:hypothetical protein
MVPDTASIIANHNHKLTGYEDRNNASCKDNQTINTTNQTSTPLPLRPLKGILKLKKTPPTAKWTTRNNCCSVTSLWKWTRGHALPRTPSSPPCTTFQQKRNYLPWLLLYGPEWQALVPLLLFGISAGCLLAYSKPVLALHLFLVSLVCDRLLDNYSNRDPNYNNNNRSNWIARFGMNYRSGLQQQQQEFNNKNHRHRRVYFPKDTQFTTAGKAKRRRKQRCHRVVHDPQAEGSTVSPPPPPPPPPMPRIMTAINFPSHNRTILTPRHRYTHKHQQRSDSTPPTRILQPQQVPRTTDVQQVGDCNTTNTTTSGSSTTSSTENRNGIHEHDDLCAVKALVGDLATFSQQWKQIMAQTQEASLQMKRVQIRSTTAYDIDVAISAATSATAAVVEDPTRPPSWLDEVVERLASPANSPKQNVSTEKEMVEDPGNSNCVGDDAKLAEVTDTRI